MWCTHLTVPWIVTWKMQVRLHQLICVYFYLFLKHLGSSNISLIQSSALVTLAYTPGYPGVWRKKKSPIILFLYRFSTNNLLLTAHPVPQEVTPMSTKRPSWFITRGPPESPWQASLSWPPAQIMLLDMRDISNSPHDEVFHVGTVTCCKMFGLHTKWFCN